VKRAVEVASDEGAGDAFVQRPRAAWDVRTEVHREFDADSRRGVSTGPINPTMPPRLAKLLAAMRAQQTRLANNAHAGLDRRIGRARHPKQLRWLAMRRVPSARVGAGQCGVSRRMPHDARRAACLPRIAGAARQAAIK
jgi:hypothetical protein